MPYRRIIDAVARAMEAQGESLTWMLTPAEATSAYRKMAEAAITTARGSLGAQALRQAAATIEESADASGLSRDIRTGVLMAVSALRVMADTLESGTRTE